MPGAVNVHFPGLWVLPLLVALRISAPKSRLVLSFHGADINQLEHASPVERFLWRTLLERTDLVTCCSAALLGRLERATDADIRSKVVLNGIDSMTVDEEASAVPQLPTELQNCRYISNVGTFEHKKGQDVLLKAFSQLRRRHPDLQLVLAGRVGPALDDVRSMVVDLGLTSCVHEFIDAPHSLALRLIQGSSVFALSSRQEPFGIVLLEAAHFRVPTVASEVGGVPEIFEHGKSCLLVPPDAPDILAAAIQELLEDPELGTRLAAAAHARVESFFTGVGAYERYLSAMRPMDRGNL